MSYNMYSLTNPQKSIWQTGEFYKGTSIENIAGRATILEKVDFKKFEKAINLFIEKNDSFRLKFVIDNTEVKQYVEDYKYFSFEKISVSSEKDVKKIEDEFANYVFDVLDSYLFKFVLYEFEDGHGGFVIVMHHLISDAWTSGLVISEIINYYDALKNNEEIPNEKAPSYLEYIESEKEYKNTDKFNSDKEFWNGLFEEVPEVATIPSVNSNSISCKAKRKQFIINKNLIDIIHDFCKAHKVSEFNFFMGILSIYLGRVSNLDEFVIGTPILNRSNFKEKHTAGMFISVVPFKVSLKNSGFIEFISNISKDFMSIFRHQKYSYQTLLEDLRKKHGNSIPNLYNVMFSYQNMRSNKQTAKTNYDSKWLFCNNISDDLEVHMYDINDTGDIIMAYDFKSEKYQIDDIYSIHERILNIINQILDNNDISLNDIEIVTPDEKRKLLYDFNNTKMDYPKDKTIVELFEKQVLKTPDNIAVVFEDKSLTYKELNEKANSLAYYLRDHEVSRNDIVGIMVNRSLEMIVSSIAVLKAGACYIPIDPEYPQDRIKYMLANSNSKILLTFKYLQNKVNFKNKIFVELDNNLYNFHKKNLNNINEPEDLAYMIYTSGSTGMPKGVMLIHKSLSNLTNYCNNYIEYLKKNKYRTIVSVTTISFDIFIFETLISLQKGLKLVIANENEQTIPRLLNTLIEKNNVEIIQTTPSRMQLLVNNIADIPMLSNLKYITLAGEQLPISLASKLKEIGSPIIYNGYGPSETTVFSTLTDITNHSQITIGKPLDNTQIYILDKNMNLCPINIPGDIYIAGDGVGLGYMNNPKLTMQSYLANPFSEENKIIYKSGDVGYYLPNGEIMCLGRSDHQVKIRGLRIELGEIENIILQNKKINNCVVIKNESENNHEFLCAYYTSNQEIDVSSLRALLQERLPKYMVPQYFVKLDKLPYTPNGKIDRKRLPMPNAESNNKTVVLPRNEFDEKLIELLKEILNIENISIEDSFFDLGGDSLAAINLCTKIYSEFNVQIYVKDIMKNPIIEKLSDFIASKSITPSENVISKAEKLSIYPISSAQRRTYFASSAAGENSVLYNICGGLILDKIPDITKLENAFKTLIKRQSALRTYFEMENNDLVQKIKDNINFTLDINSNLIAEGNLKQCFKEFTKPFNLSKAPLFRVKLQYMQNKKAILMVDMHHIISDGTSLSVFLNELCKIYNNEELPNIKMEYKDYAVWENNKLKNNKFKEAEKYWINQFKGDIPVLDMPTNYPRPVVQSFDGEKVYSVLNSETTSKINELANTLKVTPYMILLSAYYVLLYKYTSQNDIVVGSPIVNRTNSDLYDIIGMFVNSLPMKASIDSKLSFTDFLNTIKQLCLENYNYQDYPFDELVNKLNVQKDTSRNPLFDTMFIYQNNGFIKPSFNGIDAKYYIPDTKISKFDLSLEIIPENDILNLSFEYATSLFNKDFITNLANHYINIINSILDNNKIKISEIDMLSKDEKNKILYEFNNTKMDYPKDKTIAELFEEQVEKTPNNTAIVFEDKKLTYKDLNERVNNLASYLRANQKIGRNDIVGIMINRSLEMIISVLAVLKAGGAYLLIDTSLPFDRIEYMLNNCNAKLLLTDTNYDIAYTNKINISKIPNTMYINNLDIINEPEDAFAVIYTSGSTGMPKGVLLKHVGIINLVYSFGKILELSTMSSHLGFSAVSFDMFAVELFTSILLGRTLFLLNDEEQRNPVLISKAITENKIEFLITTPTKIELLLSNPKTCECLKTLKGFQLGGEVFTPSLYEKLSKITSAKIYNGYGPTEITACCSNKLVTSKDDINIGNSNPNTQSYILDKDLNPCPVGVPGELYIAGDGVAIGYINDKEKTNISFIPNKFGNGKMYKTGDLAKFNNVGEIEYIGRNDFQVKLKGLRIELSEIEKQMLNIEYIKSCVVLTDKNKTYLKAFFTASEELNIPNIRKLLSEVLPAYMVPNYIFQIEEIPITANGKIDRNKLDEYKCDIVNNNTTYVKPENEIQKLFCDIWEEILQTKVGIDNDIFELGADSLSAIKFKVEALNHNIDIPYSDIFKYKTIRKLAGIKQKEIETTPIENYDYTKINSILKNNKMRLTYKMENSKNNNILLFGSNGFVGMHIINSFIKNDNGKIYCVMRDKNNKSAQERFSLALEFYFGKDLNDYINNRIVIVKGDISKENFGMSNTVYNEIIGNISTVINAAANVKHYGNFEKFKSINIDSTINVINFCKKYNKRLLHLSTLSISGNTFLDGSTPLKDISKADKVYFAENNLFINQSLDNVYTRSKFEAEKIILDNISLGLNATILRLGNITSRYSDGKFQINPHENAFTNRLKSVILLGVIPKSLLEQEIEFTPVDLCADAIIKIMQNRCNKISIFHVYNSNHIKVIKIISVLKDLDIKMFVVSDEEFSTVLNEALKNINSKKALSGIINDLTEDKKLKYSTNIKVKSQLSIDFLLKCKFRWKKIDKNYIEKYFDYLKNIEFFKEV